MNNDILIVDDNFRAYKSLTLNFKPLGYKTYYSSNSSEALDILKKKSFGLILLDLMLGSEDGRELLDLIVQMENSPPVIMITGFASIDSAVDSIKRGAFNYVQKPVDFDDLLKIIEKAMKTNSSDPTAEGGREYHELEESLTPEMASVLRQARKLAVTDLPILILGENGTGKELMADYIYQYSKRSSLQLHKINCAAFQESILDNELFGHNKGAYTGADGEYKGIFELAHSHTLFMDEIGDMSLSIQAKILRTLQNKEIRRIGGNRTITVDVRFIAATNKDISLMIEEKTFREDLYYRLSTAILRIPPLRKRSPDIPVLAQKFLRHHSAISGKVFAPEVLELFKSYSWPGNIRELKNAVQYALAISTENEIQVEDLPGNIQSYKNFVRRVNSVNIREQAEKDIIINCLNKHRFNKSRTASELNMSRKTLYSKIVKYEIKS